MVSPELRDILMTNYPAEEWAFLACRLDADAEHTPIAYTHDKMREGFMVAPTRHYHEKSAAAPLTTVVDVERPWKLRNPRLSLGEDEGDEKEESWDHEIFVMGSTLMPDWCKIRSEQAIGERFSLGTLGAVPFALPLTVRGSSLQRITIKEPMSRVPNEDIFLYCESQLMRWPKCTRRLFGADTHAVQSWFGCLTCETAAAAASPAARAKLAGQGICGPCARTCHADHDVYEAITGSFFCDCGAPIGASCSFLHPMPSSTPPFLSHRVT